MVFQMALARFLESYVFGPAGFWTMAPLLYAAKFAIWEPWYQDSGRADVKASEDEKCTKGQVRNRG